MKILVHGLGAVGSLVAGFEGFEGVHHADYKTPEGYDALVNCAGIAGANKCQQNDWSDVMDANVMLPIHLQHDCRNAGIPYIHISTPGVYKKQVCYDLSEVGDGIEEHSPTFPHNLSVASEILAEMYLMEMQDGRSSKDPDIYIFRVSWFVNEERLRQRTRYMHYFQQTWTSVTHPNTLAQAVANTVKNKPCAGIYNINTETLWFPDFMSRYTDKPHVEKREHAKDATSAVPTNTTKAKGAGILHE